ncbi:hypothetical protein KC906_00985, partial [Candidatus Kaiserbacteria bacterium]|nr:hypothetical protein [Candidatus Kaiserbacteria bacterium]
IGFDCSEVEGTGINCSGEAITLDTTGSWTGTLDGVDSTGFLLSGASDSYTSGTLTFDSGTSLDLNTANLSIADTSINFDGASTNFNVTGDWTVNSDDLLVDKTTGYVSVGSSSPNAKLSVENLNFSGAGVVGMDQYYETENSVLSAVQYGNRFYLDANNTATTTIVGSMFRIQDDTTYGNTVRGLEVQSNKGVNTNGENTALSGFARTFGVRGVTSGDAGGTHEPAGGYFETEGAAQGNAIRGYSDTITTATLLSLFQDTSAFAGTGLEMNFGNTTGSFSSTTSKYLDFQNAGTSVFTVSAFGTTTIGRNDGNTSNQAGLQIPYGGLCVDNDGECNASTTGRISAINYHTGDSDLAEMYFSGTELETGEVVMLAGGLSIDRALPGADTPVIGIVSTKPGMTLGADDKSLVEGERGYPVALTGRVPVKLSTENGPIKKGDVLMLSSLPGVAMKATGTGATIGIALEDFDDTRMYSDTLINQFGDDLVHPVYEPINSVLDPRINDGCYYSGGGAIGDEPCVPLAATTTDEQIEEANDYIKQQEVAQLLEEMREIESETVVLNADTEVQVGQIVVFVDLSYRWVDDSQLATLGALMGTASLSTFGEDETETLFDRLVALADRFVDGVLSVFTLKADRVEVAEELCVDDVCITAADLRALLNGQAAAAASTAPEAPVADEDEDEDVEDGGNSATNETGDGENSTEEDASIATSSTPTPDATTTAVTAEEDAASSMDVVEEESDAATTTPAAEEVAAATDDNEETASGAADSEASAESATDTTDSAEPPPPEDPPAAPPTPAEEPTETDSPPEPDTTEDPLPATEPNS